MSKSVLITGITGHIAKHTALAYLREGLRVRGTLRDPAKAEAVRLTLSAHVDVGKLEFAVADLRQDAGWKEAVAGMDGVIHVASPNPVIQPKDENDTIRPAVEGTMRVLRAAADGKVGRFVQTSSVVAMMYGHERGKIRFDENDWSDPEANDATPYSKSKVLSERAAREFIGQNDTGMSYASVNPGYVFGPLLDRHMPGSIQMIQMLMAGKYPGSSKSHMPVADARDVAEAHLRAFLSPRDGGRYPVASGSLWMVEMSRAIREALGKDGGRVPRWELPNWLVRLIALFDPAPRSITPYLSREYHVDCRVTQAELGIAFVPAVEAVLASARSIAEHDLL